MFSATVTLGTFGMIQNVVANMAFYSCSIICLLSLALIALV
jgi:hypothetical protein